MLLRHGRHGRPLAVALAFGLALGLGQVSCAEGESSRSKPVLRPEEPVVTLPARPDGWPYWVDVPVRAAPPRPGLSRPVVEKELERPGGAEARWASLPATVRAQILADGLAIPAGQRRSPSLGSLYESLACAGVPRLVSLDAFFAVALLATEGALADAEARVTARALGTLLARLDARLQAGAVGARPDLLAGLRVADSVVAVARTLLDPSYEAAPSVRDDVAVELTHIRGHAGIETSRVLGVPIDYAAFAPRGALGDDPRRLGQFLAAEWLGLAPFTFAAGETTTRVDMGAARARARGALLLARLVGKDGDAAARLAALELERLASLSFGDPDGADLVSLADFASAHAYDLADTSAIVDAPRLESLRRAAETSLGSVLVDPLRRAPEDLAVPGPSPRSLGAPPRANEVTAWLASPAWASRGAVRHASFYASGLDAIAASIGPSMGDHSLASAGTDALRQRRAASGAAAWALLRHASVPFARTHALAPAGEGPGGCVDSPAALVLVDPHPEAIAALLGLVRQVMTGLDALAAVDSAAPSRSLLVEAQSILLVALAAAAEEAAGPTTFSARASELANLPRRIAALEARLAPAGGPFAAVVYGEPARGEALVARIHGLDLAYMIVADPRTGRPVLAAGAALSADEARSAAAEVPTDRSCMDPPRPAIRGDAGPFGATVEVR